MTFDHRLKEGRERVRWLIEKEHSEEAVRSARALGQGCIYYLDSRNKAAAARRR